MSNAPDWATVNDDESVVWQGHPVIYHFLDGLLFAAILLGVAAVVAVLWPFEPAVAGQAVAAGLGGLGVLVALWTLVERWRVKYLVTTEQVYVKRGLVSRTVKNVRFEQIQNATFKETVFGRLLSYGDVHIDTAGGEGPELVLRNVADPENVLGFVSQGTGGS